MGFIRHHRALTITLLVALTGCGGTGTGDSVGRSKQLIRGNAAQGSTVDAHAVDANGEAVAASDPESNATADTSGSYAIEVEVEVGTLTEIVVESTSGAMRQACLVESSFDANLAADGAVVAEPMTAETTFEADVFVQIVKDDALCDGCTAATIRDWVGENAASVQGSANTQASLAASAEAAATATSAFHAALVSSANGGSASITTAESAHVDAAADRASALDVAATVGAEDAAEAAYLDAVVAGYTSAGVDLDEQGAAAQAAAEAGLAALAADASVATTLGAALAADLESKRAAHVTAAVEAHAAASGASEAAVVSAGETLATSLAAAATAGAAADAQIDLAWDTYRASVEASIRASLAAPEQVSFDAAVAAFAAAAATMQTTLDASVPSSTNASVWIMPMLTFSASGSAETDALVTAGVGATQASALVKILIALELAAS